MEDGKNVNVNGKINTLYWGYVQYGKNALLFSHDTLPLKLACINKLSLVVSKLKPRLI